MNIGAISKSLTIGITCTAAAYAVLNGKKKRQHCFKKDASKAITAFSEIIDSIF